MKELGVTHAVGSGAGERTKDLLNELVGLVTHRISLSPHPSAEVNAQARLVNYGSGSHWGTP